ncbi:hypothetical protein DQ04_02521060 [Trypanosoma grayi]|uniref:hypothetical protein n=1 Tax=Trypanosoma grayi TaxID=71804 RepID=UPI0004F4B054|nr:hypothetical protein DQ04_02521060 [Trypanosoma grayi]KEG11540.1 hypothetical protein DQ04_02521060 [Trypanosoma grayi]
MRSERSLEALASLFRLVKRTEGGNSLLIDPEFRDVVQQALGTVEEWMRTMHDGRARLATAPIISAVLSAFYVKKSRVVEAVLPVLQQLIQGSFIPYNTAIILYQSQNNKKALLCGEALFCAMGDFLRHASEPVMYLKCVEILHDIVSDDGFSSFTGKCVTRCVQICSQITLQSSHEGARAISRDLFLLCVLRVTRNFVEAALQESESSIFASNTVLDDYMHDVEPDAPYTKIVIEGFTTSLEPENRADRLKSNEFKEESMTPAVEDTLISSGSLRPFEYLRGSLDDSIVASAVSTLRGGSRFPDAMKDLLLLIRHTCKLASRACSGSGSTSEANPEVRARQLALEMVEAVFLELPVANCDVEHRCATWLSLVLAATKYDILRCIARNVSTVVPACFFATSVRVLTLLLRKCHYHLARELHALLAIMLFPLAQSKFSSFSQKYAVLGMVRELFRVPHLCVSFFINYDCNPTFDAGAKYGGMLELMVDFVVGMIFSDFFEPDWISLDQQQLLRSECASAMHSLVESMLRWVAEDPRGYMQRQARETAGRALTQPVNGSHAADRWHEVYLDNWGSDDKEQESDTSELLSGDASTDSLSDEGEDTQSMWGKNRNVGYHWKHIHCLLQNKRIAQEALQIINKGRWREGMELLRQRGYIPSTDEAASWTAFARFLKTYSGVERSALCMIFERVLKDPDCDRILKEYLQLFSYEGVPIDIALRDTTCEFMSWDRPTFEAQVWGVVQERFGEAYGKQNPRSITTKDANAMAGVLLFLHASLHNESAKSCRMTIEEFVKNGNECVDFPFPEQEMREMYHRVARRKWELDELQRTPRQVEVDMSTPALSAKISQQQMRSSMSNATDAASEEVPCSARRSDFTSGSPLHINVPDKHEDSSLLDVEVQPYTAEPEGFRLRESYHQRYVDVAAQHLWRLECEHRLQHAERCGGHPYVVPHYAQHVRPMLLMLYPKIAATLYMGFRVLEEQPIFRLLLDTYQTLYDVAAAFVVNLSGLRVAVERMIQRCLDEEGAQQLPPPIRATFALPLMNLV